MDELFSDTVNEMILDSITMEIQENLFDQWNNSNLDEGILYAEYRFFEYASDDVKQQYNEFYGYGVNDEYYLA